MQKRKCQLKQDHGVSQSTTLQRTGSVGTATKTEESKTSVMEYIRENGATPEQNISKDISNSRNRNDLHGLKLWLDLQEHILKLGEELENKLEIIAEKKTLDYQDLLNLAIFGKIDIVSVNILTVSFLLTEEEVKELETRC